MTNLLTSHLCYETQPSTAGTLLTVCTVRADVRLEHPHINESNEVPLMRSVCVFLRSFACGRFTVI